MNKLLKFCFIAISISTFNSSKAMEIKNIYKEEQGAAYVAELLTCKFCYNERKAQLLSYDLEFLKYLRGFLIRNPFDKETLENILPENGLFYNVKARLHLTYYSLIKINDPYNSNVFYQKCCKPTYKLSDEPNVWVRDPMGGRPVIIKPDNVAIDCTKIELFVHNVKKREVIFDIPFNQIKTVSLYETSAYHDSPDLFNYMIITDITNNVSVYKTTTSKAELMFKLPESFEIAYFNEFQRYMFCITSDGKTKVIDFDLIVIIDSCIEFQANPNKKQ